MRPLNNDKGFTLIEVLLASVILIITISTMTLIYRTAAISSLTASDNVKLNGSVGFIMNDIKSQVRGNNATTELSGKGILSGVEYAWRTELEQLKSAPPRFDTDAGWLKNQPKRFYLWNVKLNVSYKGRQLDFVYKEISWKIR
jgi:prepilin-type N-terminal cleavage/methylation domain-containing protein